MANCPNCGPRSQLVDAPVEQARARACPRCLGAWLTPRDLTRISEMGFMPLVGLIQERWGAAPEYSVAIQHDFRICPQCNQGLERGEFAMNSAIACDRCPKGHGTWIDFLELKGIVDYLVRIRRQESGRSRRRPGFLSELKGMIYRLFNP